MRWLVAVAGALSVLLPAGLAHALTPQELCKAGEKQYCPPPPVHHPATTHRVHASQPAAPVAETPQPAALVPEMVVIPTGSFSMGSPASEPGRFTDEGPQHFVTIGYRFEVSKYPITFEEWDACVSDGGCNNYRPADQGWGRGARPVINVSWDDAQSYVRWLSGKTGQPYRLLSEAEYEYVNRAGATTAYWWGNDPNAACAYANGPDLDFKANYSVATVVNCHDGFVNTSPVGHFLPNAFGLYDTTGNVWEWVEDCYHGSYDGAPTDGSPWTTGDCSQRVLRGGSWGNLPASLRAADRSGFTTDGRIIGLGFRVARTL